MKPPKPIHYRTYGGTLRPGLSRVVNKTKWRKNAKEQWEKVTLKEKIHVPADYLTAYCGVRGKDWQKKKPGGEPWKRITSKIHNVTCEHCLAALIQDCKQALHKRAQIMNGTIRDVVRQAHGRMIWHGLETLTEPK